MSVSLFGSSQRRHVLKMVMGFFDESADPHAEFICMSGYLADAENWEALSRDWNRLLTKHQIPYMHLSDFIASKGVYEELGWNEETKNSQIDQVLDDFIAVIRRHTLAGIGVGVAARKYREILKDVRKKFKPEVFCFERVLRCAMGRLSEWGMDDPIWMIFDDSEAYSMKAYANLCELKRSSDTIKRRVAGIGFCDDEVFIPLQAADFLAHATVRMHSQGGDGAWVNHPQFKKLLLDENPAFGKVYDSEHWTEQDIERIDLDSEQPG